jgi:hypothetical protein
VSKTDQAILAVLTIPAVFSFFAALRADGDTALICAMCCAVVCAVIVAVAIP